MDAALTSQDILRRYAKGDRDFSGLNLNGIKLSGANLSRTDWLDAPYAKISQSQAYLTDSYLSAFQ
jgi:uncharacterized protein YjbI with pentapeptide repeats